METNLASLKRNQVATIRTIQNLDRKTINYLKSLGFSFGEKIKIKDFSFLKKNVLVEVLNCEYALACEIAKNIMVEL